MTRGSRDGSSIMQSLQSTQKNAGTYFTGIGTTGHLATPANPEQPAADWRFRALAACLILASAILHVGHNISSYRLDLAPDEAHYWDWSRHLDWSYYSKGPGVAYLIRAGCWLAGPWSEARIGDQMAAVRLPAVVCGSLLLVSLYVLAYQVFRRDGLALGIVAIGLTMPPIALGSSLMTIDSPYCCCWGWALVAGHRAIFRQSTAAWIAAGLLVGLGILAKYTMVLWLPSVGLYLLLAPEHRRELIKPGFWMAVAISGLCCLPILFWNMQHGWVTFHHVNGLAGMSEDRGLNWLGPLKYLGAQAGILLGFWFAFWVGAMVHFRPGRAEGGTAYLWWMSAPMFLVFLGFSFKTDIEPNWPVTAYLSGLVLAAGWLSDSWSQGTAGFRLRLKISLVTASFLGLAVTGLMYFSVFAHPAMAALAGPPSDGRPTPLRRLDPTCRLRGWNELGAEVDKLIAHLSSTGKEPVVAASSWWLTGELGFYCKNHPTVYCLGILQGERHSQCDFWHPNPIDEAENFRHRDFIYVGDLGPDVAKLFDRVETEGNVVHKVGNHPVAIWTIHICRGYRGAAALPPALRPATF